MSKILDLLVGRLREFRHGRLRRLDPLWLPLGRAYRRLVSRPAFATSASTSIGGYGPFRVDGVFAFSNLEHWGRGHNEGFRACIERSRGARCVLDVGAHVGLVSLPLSTVVADDGVVVAFEPGELNRHLLSRHVQLNDIRNVEVVDALVGPESLEAVEFWELPTEPTGMNSLLAPEKRPGYIRTSRRQVTLDDICADRGWIPDVVKVDVEGAEVGVLTGARGLLTQARPWIYLSAHPGAIQRLGSSSDELVGLIHDLGYEIQSVDGRPHHGLLEMREYVLVPEADR